MIKKARMSGTARTWSVHFGTRSSAEPLSFLFIYVGLLASVSHIRWLSYHNQHIHSFTQSYLGYAASQSIDSDHRKLTTPHVMHSILHHTFL